MSPKNLCHTHHPKVYMYVTQLFTVAILAARSSAESGNIPDCMNMCLHKAHVTCSLHPILGCEIMIYLPGVFLIRIFVILTSAFSTQHVFASYLAHE